MKENFVSNAIKVLVGMSLGFGVSQASIGFTVKTHDVEIKQIKDSRTEILRAIEGLSKTSSDHMREAIDTMNKAITANENISREFIATIKFQNELIIQGFKPKI